MTEPVQVPSERVRLRRGAQRAHYDHDAVLSVLEAGIVAHLGVMTDDGPIVIPMAYGHDTKHLYLHGAAANAAIKSGNDTDVCVTVTIVDGLIFARSPFHNSMRYRPCVVRGTLTPVTDVELKRQALQLIADHVVPNWESGRPVTPSELRRTTVSALSLTEASVKIRTGDANDEPEDLNSEHWAGAVPLITQWGPLEPAENLHANVAPPAPIAAIVGTRITPGEPQ